MATTEHNIVMNEVIMHENGSKDTKILYPTTKAEICLCEDGETVEEKLSKTINSENGINGMRYYNGKLQILNSSGEWQDVENGSSISENELFKPYDLSNISIKAGDTKVTIKWTDPVDKVIDGITVCKWKNTKLVMKTGSYPTNAKDGTLMVDNQERNKYQSNGYTITGLNNNTTYYFRFFIYSNDGVVNANEVNKAEAIPITIPPQNVSNINCKAGNGKVTVSWTDPGDTIENGTTTCKWKGTKLVYKAGSYPTSASDGTIAVDNQTLNAYKTSGFEITNLQNDVTYYFQLFPYSELGSYNTNVANRFEATPKAVTVYGVQRQISSSSTAWQRIESGVGLVANANTSTTAVKNDFDSLYPWSEIKTCDISANGTVNSYIGDANFSFTNPKGYIMTEVPEFWYKRIQENGYEKIYIADNEYEDFKKSKKFYIGRYTAGGSSSALNCKSGVSNCVNITLPNARTAAKKIGSNWGLMDITSWSAIQMLYLVEYADYNCQTKVGAGRCSSSNSSAINTGRCDSLNMKSGYISNTNNNGVIYRGIENPWGNIFQWLDGINITNRQAWICRNLSNYASDKFASPYTKLGYVNCSSSGYISKVGYDANNSDIQLPTEASGSDTTKIPDYYWQNSGNCVVYVGGYWDNDARCGLWFWACGVASSHSYSSVGCRLLFTPV